MVVCVVTLPDAHFAEPELPVQLLRRGVACPYFEGHHRGLSVDGGFKRCDHQLPTDAQTPVGSGDGNGEQVRLVYDKPQRAEGQDAASAVAGYQQP